MNWKKVLLVTLALVLVVGLVACGGKKEAVDDGAAEAPVAEGAALKIAIVTSPSGVDDGSFNQNCYEGIKAFIANNPNSTVTPIQEADMANSVQAVEAIVADYDVIVTPGFQFAGISTVAMANPEKAFILVDSNPADPADPNNFAFSVDNIYAMTFAEQESGFFAGIAAAMETKTGKVAFIGGQSIPPVTNYQLGFESGVNYANKNLGTKAEMVTTSYADPKFGGNYIDDFVDQARGKSVGEAVIAKKADVLFVAAGGAGLGAFTAAKEAKDVWIIGCDVDQFDLGADGDRNVVLTSGLKVMDINVERQLNAIADGTFKGGNYTLQADTDSTGFVSAPGRHQLSDATLAELNKAFEAVKGGTIVPAATFSDFTPKDFPGL